MLFNNILVVIEPEDEQQIALKRAVSLVQQLRYNNINPKLTLILAIYEFNFDLSSILSSEDKNKENEEIVKAKKEWIKSLTEKYSDLEINFEIEVIWGTKESNAVTDMIARNSHDLVIKTSQVNEGLSSLFSTPNDWQILRAAPCPILLVKNEKSEARRILVALNLSDDSEYQQLFNDQLINAGIDLSGVLSSGNVHLVCAYPVTQVNMAIDLPEFNNNSNNPTGIRGQHLISMKALRQQYQIDEDHTHVHEGLPEEVIPRVANEINAELIILGTVGRTGLSAAFLGNTAEHVVNCIDCNLLAIKPEENIEE